MVANYLNMLQAMCCNNGAGLYIKNTHVTINVLSEIRRSRSFIPEDYSRQHTGMAESRMGEEEA